MFEREIELKSEMVPEDGLQKLVDSGELFVELFRHGTLSIEVYMPAKNRRCKNLMIVMRSISSFPVMATFFSGNEVKRFRTGDLFFVPAGEPHHFDTFLRGLCHMGYILWSSGWRTRLVTVNMRTDSDIVLYSHLILHT
jgi:hypothetical protein